MKTLFKVFKIDYNISKLENFIKRYQEELCLEIKNVVVLKEYEDETIVGVIFEEDAVSRFNKKYRDSCKSAIAGFMSPPVPGVQ